MIRISAINKHKPCTLHQKFLGSDGIPGRWVDSRQLQRNACLGKEHTVLRHGKIVDLEDGRGSATTSAMRWFPFMSHNIANGVQVHAFFQRRTMKNCLSKKCHVFKWMDVLLAISLPKSKVLKSGVIWEHSERDLKRGNRYKSMSWTKHYIEIRWYLRTWAVHGQLP